MNKIKYFLNTIFIFYLKTIDKKAHKEKLFQIKMSKKEPAYSITAEPNLKLIKDLDESKSKIVLLIDEIKRNQAIVDDLHHRLKPADPTLKSAFNKVVEAQVISELLCLDLDQAKKKAIALENIIREYSKEINMLEFNYYYKLVRK